MCSSDLNGSGIESGHVAPVTGGGAFRKENHIGTISCSGMNLFNDMRHIRADGFAELHLHRGDAQRILRPLAFASHRHGRSLSFSNCMYSMTAPSLSMNATVKFGDGWNGSRMTFSPLMAAWMSSTR